MRAGTIVLGALLVAACGGDDGGSATPTGTTGEPSGGIVLDADGGDKLDLGGGAEGTGMADGAGDAGSGSGCKKVDLLFVIDNSGSMEDEQSNLVASFPGFIEAMQTTLSDTQGYHVGVISSDLYTGDFSCAEEGALITRTNGEGSSNADCAPYSSGQRFMTEADDLADKFACAAQVGISGDGDERPMQTMLAAVSDDMGAPGACNEGFVRDDALLVVVIITDEEDDHEQMGCVGGDVNADPLDGSDGEPPQWFQELVEVKGGNEKSVVVLALVGPREGETCPELQKCDGGIDGAEVTDRIIDFTEMFTYGVVGPVCQPYGPFFEAAIGHIESACDDFVPVG
jgi:hypothetical protein